MLWFLAIGLGLGWVGFLVQGEFWTMVFSKLVAVENPSRSKYDRVCRDAAVEFLKSD